MSKDIIDKVNKEEWHRAIHISELVCAIIDSHLTQSHISKLDKDISKHIENAADSIYKANILIKEKLKKKDE